MTKLVLVAALAALALLGGIAYAAQMGGSNTLNACAKTEGGQLRLDRGGGCLPSEQSVALAGAPDTTVRFMSGFIPDGTTSSAAVPAADGRLGTLSFTCGSVSYDTNPADSAAFADRINFYSPEDASSPLQVLDHLTVNGFVRPFPEFSGCSYYAYVQNADTRLPETRTP